MASSLESAAKFLPLPRGHMTLPHGLGGARDAAGGRPLRGLEGLTLGHEVDGPGHRRTGCAGGKGQATSKVLTLVKEVNVVKSN